MTIGALLGDTPHSRPIKCTGSATDEVLAARLGMQRSRYEGPTGIVGVLHDAVRRAGFPSASIWAPVPHYVATPPNPKATRALLDSLGELLDLDLDLTDLDIASSAWERSVSEVVAGDADVSSYVERLEARYDTDGRRADWIETDDEIAIDDDDEDDRLVRRGRPPVGRSRSPKTSSATSATTDDYLDRGGRGRGRARGRVDRTSDSVSTRSSLPWNIDA